MTRSSKNTAQARMPEAGHLVAERYRLVDEIASGGMGVVMRATDESMGRDVGLKLLHAHIAGEEGFVDRFEREAKVATLFNHPNVTRVYDFGKTDEGLLYLVMELLEGEDLKALIRRNARMTAGRTNEIILQTLDGLAEAHSMGVVHRDLKPSNIFLSRTRRGKEVVKILDFGVAKLLESTAMTLTQTGMVTGTPSYIAPERLVGDVDNFSVDVYAIGLIMLEMMLGRKVFDGETMAQCLLMQLKKPVPLPRKLAETPLGDVIRKATSKHPGDRYSDAEEMLEALEDAAESTPESLRLSPADSPPRPENTSSSILDRIMSGDGDLGLLRDMPQHDSDFNEIDSLDEESAGELLRTLLIDEEDIEYLEGEDFATEPTAIVPSPLSRPEEQAVRGDDTFDVALDPGYGVNRRVVVGVSVASLVAVAIVFGWLMWDDDSSSSEDEAEVAATATTDESRDENFSGADEVDAGADEQRELVEITIESRPSGATLTDGTEAFGTTPLTLELSADTLPRTLELVKDAHKSQEVELNRDPSRSIEVELEAEEVAEKPALAPKVDEEREKVDKKRERTRTRPTRARSAPTGGSAREGEPEKSNSDESTTDVDAVLDKYLD